MNKTEEAYSQVLEAERRQSYIRSWAFEAVTLKLADDCRYTPDFMVINATDEVEFHETKGWERDDSKVKRRVAASTVFPFFRFFLVRKGKGGFEREEF